MKVLADKTLQSPFAYPFAYPQLPASMRGGLCACVEDVEGGEWSNVSEAGMED